MRDGRTDAEKERLKVFQEKAKGMTFEEFFNKTDENGGDSEAEKKAKEEEKKDAPKFEAFKGTGNRLK